MDIQKLEFRHLSPKQLSDVIDALGTVNDVMSGLLWRDVFWKGRQPTPTLQPGGEFFETLLNELYDVRGKLVIHAKALVPTLPPEPREHVVRALLREEAYHFDFDIEVGEKALALLEEAAA